MVVKLLGNGLGAYSKIRSSPRSIPMLCLSARPRCNEMRVVAGGKLGRMFFWGLLLLKAVLVSLVNGQGIVRSQ